MGTKSQAFDTFQKFTQRAERQSGKKPKHLRTDFGGEFANQSFEQYTVKEGNKWESIRLIPLSRTEKPNASIIPYCLWFARFYRLFIYQGRYVMN